MKRFLNFLSFFAATGLIISAPAFAQIEMWPNHLELFAGYNATHEADGAPAFGLRIGGIVKEKMGIDVAASFLSTDSAINQNEIRRWTVEASVVRYARKTTDAWLATLGGVGYTSTKIRTPTQSLNDGSLSFHAGIAAKWFLGKRFYLRPDMRVRMVADGDHRRGWEGSFAFGFVLNP